MIPCGHKSWHRGMKYRVVLPFRKQQDPQCVLFCTEAGWFWRIVFRPSWSALNRDLGENNGRYKFPEVCTPRLQLHDHNRQVLQRGLRGHGEYGRPRLSLRARGLQGPRGQRRRCLRGRRILSCQAGSQSGTGNPLQIREAYQVWVHLPDEGCV